MTIHLQGPTAGAAAHPAMNGATVTTSRADRGPSAPATAAGAAAGVEARPSRWLGVLRIAVGAIFLWPFLDKLFGLGYSTAAGKSVLAGSSPTNGFLSHVEVGPAQGFFRAIAGSWWADWMFMAGLGAVGVAVILGVGLRISAVAGSLLMMMMWLAEWPLARFTDAGDATGSTNPLLDYHVIYALALIAVAVTAAGRVWGLGRMWTSLPLVQRHAWLR